MEKKSCLLTTYVSGLKYQAFIPMLVYSCKKAYPEYDIMLFLHDKVQPSVKDVLQKTGLEKEVVIKENVFKDELPQITPLQAKSCRWILWDKAFLSYQYLYIIDIDMFYIREPMPLHIQHSERMKMTGLPFDNMRRKLLLHRSIPGLINRLKSSGLHNILHYLFDQNVCEERLSGLHFIDIERYYTESNISYLNAIKERLFKKYYFPEILTGNNEVLLANISKGLGYNLNILGIQTNSAKSLSFEDIYRDEFRPHHGFHLGIFRVEGFEKLNEDEKVMFSPILESDAYKYYLKQYKDIIRQKDFGVLYKNLPKLAKTYIDRLHSYYHIDYKNE